METLDLNGNPVSTVGEYEYDGDGKRVKKRVPSTGEVTVFVYDAGGKLIGEYSTVAAPQSPKVSYTTADHLGSPRTTTDQFGQVASRRDFMPYGEEIARQNYGADSIRQKFTSYERDNETDLDFAQARMHNFNLGRFSSPDPLMASAKRVLPQTWNRYTYVINNPLNLIDPSGMIWGRRDDGNGGYEYRWFPGKKVGNGWDACTGDCLILENPRIGGQSLGYAIRLNPNGFSWERIVSIDVPGARRQWLSQRDAEAINAITGGAICSLSAGFACPNKGEKIADNVAAAGDVVQAVFLIKSLIKLGLSVTTIAAIIKKSPDEVAGLIEKVSSGAIKEVGKDFFEGTKYSDKVWRQMKRGDFHAFPESVKAFQGDGVISAIKGADGVTREMLSIPGSYKGKTGVFEFIKESDGTINHRFFRPDP